MGRRLRSLLAILSIGAPAASAQALLPTDATGLPASPIQNILAPIFEADAAQPFDHAQKFGYVFYPSRNVRAPALSLNATSRNPDVAKYLRGPDFKTHLHEAYRLAQTTAGDVSRYAIKIKLHDAADGKKPNGTTYHHPIGVQLIEVTVNPDPRVYDSTDVQSTFFHEYGHAVLNLFIQSRAPQERSNLYREIASPGAEVFADVFRVLIMRIPGAHHRPRDFSWMNEDPHAFGGKKHTLLNPFRARLWTHYLQNQLDSSTYRSLLLRHLAEVFLTVTERRYEQALKGASRENEGVEMNEEFIATFDAAMAADYPF